MGEKKKASLARAAQSAKAASPEGNIELDDSSSDSNVLPRVVG
jgi:hypothetical protein